MMQVDFTPNDKVKAEYEYRRSNLVKVGSVVSPKKRVDFCDDTYQLPSQNYTVTEETLSYYVVMLQNYIVIKY